MTCPLHPRRCNSRTVFDTTPGEPSGTPWQRRITIENLARNPKGARKKIKIKIIINEQRRLNAKGPVPPGGQRGVILGVSAENQQQQRRRPGNTRLFHTTRSWPANESLARLCEQATCLAVLSQKKKNHKNCTIYRRVISALDPSDVESLVWRQTLPRCCRRRR